MQGGDLDKSSRVGVESGPPGLPPVGGAGPPSSGAGPLTWGCAPPEWRISSEAWWAATHEPGPPAARRPAAHSHSGGSLREGQPSLALRARHPLPLPGPAAPWRPTPLVLQSSACSCAGLDARTTRCCRSLQVRSGLGGRGRVSREPPVGAGRWAGPHGHLLGLQRQGDDAGGQRGGGRGARVLVGALVVQVRGDLGIGSRGP